MKKFYNRDLSWLSFNERVLQEAEDKSVPLFERLKFLAIFSSNLEEFFRIRVAFIRRLVNLKSKEKKEFDINPDILLKKIHKKVFLLQERFGLAYGRLILPDLTSNNIYILNENELDESQKKFIKEYFQFNVMPLINPIILVKKKIKTFLKTGSLYLAVQLVPSIKSSDPVKKRYTYAMVEIPSDKLNRFVLLPSVVGSTEVIFLDDIIRYSLKEIFTGFEIVEARSFKLSRDAELYIEDEFSGNIAEKIRKSLDKRSTGVPSRFLYDKHISKRFLKFLIDTFSLQKPDIVPGAKYHNFSDFFSFPFPNNKQLSYPDFIPLQSRDFENTQNYFESISAKDILLYYPFNSYSHLTDFFMMAANDESVREIKITLYRVAKNSVILESLLTALGNGIKVTIFVEIKARFDEALNLEYADKLRKAGANIIYSLPGLKVHAKTALVFREEKGLLKKYCYLSTGNFNEKTSSVYADFGFFTADEIISSEIENLFLYLESNKQKPSFNKLLTAGFNMKETLIEYIKKETDNAKKGKDAYIILKLNSLEDKKMISLLYDASAAGVKVDLVIRGICCLIPGIKGLSDNINVLSIVDRFLEHSRVYIFCNANNPIVYLSSADWMKRNLNRRIEVAFPVEDQNLSGFVKRIIDFQLNDTSKARIIDKQQKNVYRKSASGKGIPSQSKIYNYINNLNSGF